MSTGRTRCHGRCAGLLGSVAVFLVAPTAYAQELPPFQLGELVVTAGRPVSEQAGTVRVIDAREIEAMGASTLDEALALVPGLNIRTGNQGVPRVDLRGLRSRHVILLLNGIPLNSTFDGQFDPSFIPVENIAKIKVVTGTASVLYGQGGLAGVIDIVTKQGEAGWRGSASGELQQVDGRLARGVLSGAVGGVSLMVTGSAASVAGYPSVAGSPTLGATGSAERRNSGRSRTNLFALASASPTDRLHLGLSAGHSDGNYGIPTSVINDNSDPFATKPSYDRVTDRRGDFVQAAGSYEASRSVGVRGWAYLNTLDQQDARYDDSTYTVMVDPAVKGTYRQRSRTSVGGGAAQVSAEGRWGRATLGLSGEHDAWHTDLTIRDVDLGGKPRTYGLRAYTDGRSLDTYGAALEYQARPVERLGVVAGYMHHWLGRDSGTTGADGYMAAAYYDLTPGTRLRAAAAHKFRFPTIRQLYDESGGNPGLRTERANVYEVGVSRDLRGDSRVGLSVYRMDVRDYIERPAQGEPFANFQAYRMNGVEVTAETRPLERLSLRGSYSFLDARDDSPGGAREELQYRPRHRVAVAGDYGFRFGTKLTASVLRIADQFYYTRKDPLEKAQLPAYTLVDARVSQPVLSGRAALYAGASNLLDVAYEDQYGFPQATRVVYGGMSIHW
ncbi:MAG: TonB-dependent receptor [Gemmatimonadetes bacterium]|nr:TonB-dependent receptor [Gemmatimonadota bacterium]